MAHPDMDVAPKPKYAVVRRALQKMTAMEAGLTIRMDELSWREYNTINIIKSKFNEKQGEHQ